MSQITSEPAPAESSSAIAETSQSFIGQQNIQQDIRVQGRDHRPRMSSMNLSTDGKPSSVKHFPFHFFELSFRGLFRSTIKLSTTSTRLLCRVQYQNVSGSLDLDSYRRKRLPDHFPSTLPPVSASSCVTI